MKKLLISAAAFGLFVACNDEITKVNETTGIQMVAAGEELGDCSKDNAGEMLFVTDSSAVYFCADGKWQLLNGSKGNDGKDGENGKDGSSAKDTVVVSKIDTVVVTKIDSVVVHDSVVVYDSSFVRDTVYMEYKPLYDTVSTAALNQEMLAEGKYGILVDERDNKVYRTITIGQQTWMAQNLDYDGDGVTSYCFDNDLENCKKYGRMYRWAQAMNLSDSYSALRATNSSGADSILFRPARGICPTGWHIPDTSEMKVLENYITAYNTIYNPSENAVSSMMSMEKESGWNWGANKVGSDKYGFSAVPGGTLLNGSFRTLNTVVYYWTSTEASATNAVNRAISAGSPTWGYNACSKLYMLTVRCLKN